MFSRSIVPALHLLRRTGRSLNMTSYAQRNATEYNTFIKYFLSEGVLFAAATTTAATFFAAHRSWVNFNYYHFTHFFGILHIDYAELFHC